MFDLEKIELDWLFYSYKLSENDIIKIYKEEKVTQKDYLERIKEYNEKTTLLSAEDRILVSIFNEEKIKEKIEEEQKLKEMYEYPKKKYLSEEKQKEVVTGSLDIAIKETRRWHTFFKEKISLEILYYLSLEALINTVKYLVHNERPTFTALVKKSIEKKIIRYVSNKENISYNELYEIIYSCEKSKIKVINNDELKLEYDKEISILKPEEIYYKLRNEGYDVDYIKNISSDEFMTSYNDSLNDLSDIEKEVMKLLYDSNGNRTLTYKEIGEYLEIDPRRVYKIKKRSLNKLQNNEKILKYKV